MLKTNCFLLTVALSFFSLFLFKTDSNFPIKLVNHPHDIKIDHSFNTCAISTNNSFVELLNFDKNKKPSHTNHFNTFKPLDKVLVENNSHYLKVCNFFNLNLTISKIVYPFHSFL